MKITFGKRRRRVDIPDGFRLLKASPNIYIRDTFLNRNTGETIPADRLFNHVTGKFEPINWEDTHDFDGNPIVTTTADYTAVVRFDDGIRPEYLLEEIDKELNLENLND